MNLTQANYYTLEANQTYMSTSQYKQFQKCEALAMAEIKGEYVRETTAAMLVGSYVDAFFSDELPEFVSAHPEIVSTRGATKGLLKTDFRSAEHIIDQLQLDPFFMSFLTGDCQQIFTGEIAGVPFKAKLDFLCENKIVDLKIVRDFNDIWSEDEGRRVSWIRYWGHDIQGAIYQHLVGNTLPFYLAAATRENVMDKSIIQIADHVLEMRLKEIEAFAPRFQSIKMGLVEPVRCEVCDYCKLTKKLSNVCLYEGD